MWRWACWHSGPYWRKHEGRERGWEGGHDTAGRVGTGTPATRVLGLVTLAAIAVLGLFALVLSPADELQGDSVRLLYVHVPAASLAYLVLRR